MAGETILQLGAGAWMTWTIERLKAAGYRVFAADKNPEAPAFPLADGHAPVDIVDASAIEAYAREVKADLVLVVNGAGVISGATASARLGLPGLPVDVATRAQDKGSCRDAWAKAGLAQPEYRVVEGPAGIAAAADTIGYPAVVKPTRAWGSRGVAVVCSRAEIDAVAATTRREGFEGPMIVERCITGIEVSVEGLVQRGVTTVLAIGDKEMQDHPTFRVGMVLNYPTYLPREPIEVLCAKAIAAMGIENGAFDAELMVDERGVPHLLEINPRPGGGHILGVIVEAVSGVAMPEAYAKILLGEDVDVRPRHQKGACYKFFNAPYGTFRGVSGLAAMKTMPGVVDASFEMVEGTKVGPIARDADRPGFVVARGETREDAIANADRAIGALRFEMAP